MSDSHEGKTWVYIEALDQGFWMTPERVKAEKALEAEIRAEQQKYIDSLRGNL
jgi:hypothetical protein